MADWTSSILDAGSSWGNDLFSQGSDSSTVGGASTGSSSGFVDSLGGVMDTAGNWLGKYLQYQNQKDLIKYQTQAGQQESIISTVETMQNTGATPFTLSGQVPGVQSGGNGSLLLMAAAIGAALLVLK